LFASLVVTQSMWSQTGRKRRVGRGATQWSQKGGLVAETDGSCSDGMVAKEVIPPSQKVRAWFQSAERLNPIVGNSRVLRGNRVASDGWSLKAPQSAAEEWWQRRSVREGKRVNTPAWGKKGECPVEGKGTNAPVWQMVGGWGGQKANNKPTNAATVQQMATARFFTPQNLII